MKQPSIFRQLIERFGKGIALVFVLVGIPIIVIGLILLLIPFIGWIFAIPVLTAGAVITFIGITIAARTAVNKRHIHVHPQHHTHTYYETQSETQEGENKEELEVKGNLICYRCGTYISEKDKVCKECGARQ